MESIKEFVDEIAEAGVAHFSVLDVALVGSTYILGEGQDVDVLVLVTDLDNAASAARWVGYSLEGEESYESSTFYSMRRGNVNVLLTETHTFFELFTKAAQICRLFKVSDKASLIKVHRLLMDDEPIYVS